MISTRDCHDPRRESPDQRPPFGDRADIFEQDVGLLELRRENVTIVGVPGKVHARRSGRLVGHGDAGLDAELRVSGFTLADAFDFRCMQSVELVLSFGCCVRMCSARSSKVFNW